MDLFWFVATVHELVSEVIVSLCEGSRFRTYTLETYGLTERYAFGCVRGVAGCGEEVLMRVGGFGKQLGGEDTVV